MLWGNFCVLCMCVKCSGKPAGSLGSQGWPKLESNPPLSDATLANLLLQVSVNLREALREQKGDVRPVGMGAGYLQTYQSMLQVRHQVLVLLMSDWTVLCYDHALNLLWKSSLRKRREEGEWQEGLSIT